MPSLVIGSSCLPFLLFLLQIVWENWFKNDGGNDCLMTVDGIDFRIPEHGKVFYSHSSSRSLDFVMKWDSALQLVILFGSRMVHMSVVAGLILASSDTIF